MGAVAIRRAAYGLTAWATVGCTSPFTARSRCSQLRSLLPSLVRNYDILSHLSLSGHPGLVGPAADGSRSAIHTLFLRRWAFDVQRLTFSAVLSAPAIATVLFTCRFLLVIGHSDLDIQAKRPASLACAGRGPLAAGLRCARPRSGHPCPPLGCRPGTAARHAATVRGSPFLFVILDRSPNNRVPASHSLVRCQRCL